MNKPQASAGFQYQKGLYMNITVFLASNTGKDPSYAEAARDFGRWIAQHGHKLIYGGANDGLMTVLADSVLDHGGQVTGIMPAFMAQKGRNHSGLTSMRIVSDMEERKKALIDAGDAYVALPGGPGTLEEISQAISAVRLGLNSGPCIFLNLNGFYEPVKQLLGQMEEQEFVREGQFDNVYFPDTVEELGQILEEKHRMKDR